MPVVSRSEEGGTLQTSPSGHRGPRNRHSEFSAVEALAGALEAGAGLVASGAVAAASLEDR